MNCEGCKFYQRYYVYSKEKGFTGVDCGKCSKDLDCNPKDCFGFERVENKVVYQKNFYFEDLILDIAQRCEEIVFKLKKLLDLYNKEGVIQPQIKDNIIGIINSYLNREK